MALDNDWNFEFANVHPVESNRGGPALLLSQETQSLYCIVCRGDILSMADEECGIGLGFGVGRSFEKFTCVGEAMWAWIWADERSLTVRIGMSRR